MYEFLPCVKDRASIALLEFSIDSHLPLAYEPPLKKSLQL